MDFLKIIKVVTGAGAGLAAGTVAGKVVYDNFDKIEETVKNAIKIVLPVEGE